MTNQPTIHLNDGHDIPAVGFGTFQIPSDGSTKQAVTAALDAGYRHIDTAVAYFNEAEVGQAIAASAVPRDQIWVTSKLWLQDYGYEAAKRAIDTSLTKLDLDYLDLYLIHQPYGDVPGAWRAMTEAQQAGKLKSIGVSNMTPKIWQQFVPDFTVKPAVNQVEFNPTFQQRPLRDLMAADDVKLEAWAPLGQGNQDLLQNPVVTALAAKYGKDVGQIILRFENQLGVVVLPKSVHAARIKSNLDIFDFTLTAEEMQQLAALDTGKGRHDPDAPGVQDMLLGAFDVHAND
ncbi:MAG: aldo/keto reductase [Levilactobacillus sp.]|jgi:diketogulonate reductase-like aldo/keto reductase|uniref:aldo/keto reductase n=1 Tax=Levilactobacillus sp. TaxID=2767919 RepID=UPI0025833F5D|nr:aldo/keto reductase [Levilactobacillus sp.]MCI1553113.1 aldo/keto reductase [Levilactobacillus sp.]MCI1598768.1 aldo/keto reductase [Levilactobacillus sp.]MCI1605190.1 aldo/keto reductase [Levilactobacillus sp.]